LFKKTFLKTTANSTELIQYGTKNKQFKYVH